MKNWKQFTFVAIIAIVGIVMGFVACDNDNGKDDPVLCTCNPKEHYLPCTCNGEDCTCKVIPRGYITEYETNAQIPIYQTLGVTDTQATTVTAAIISGYSMLPNADRQQIEGKIKEFRIVTSENDFDKTGEQRVIYICATKSASYSGSHDEEIGEYLWLTVVPAIR